MRRKRQGRHQGRGALLAFLNSRPGLPPVNTSGEDRADSAGARAQARPGHRRSQARDHGPAGCRNAVRARPARHHRRSPTAIPWSIPATIEDPKVLDEIGESDTGTAVTMPMLIERYFSRHCQELSAAKQSGKQRAKRVDLLRQRFAPRNDDVKRRGQMPCMKLNTSDRAGFRRAGAFRALRCGPTNSVSSLWRGRRRVLPRQQYPGRLARVQPAARIATSSTASRCARADRRQRDLGEYS